jgi:hypothetical protein
MNPIHPWVNPAELRRLAEQLLTPVPEPTVHPADAGFGDQFVGYSSAPAQAAPVTPPPSRPAALEQAPAPRPQPQPTAAEQAAPASTPQAEGRGPFLDRVMRFRDWLHHHFRATGVFLLDREGAVIFDESGHGKLHFLARSLAVASRRPGGTGSNVHVKVGASATLEVIPVDTPYGCLVLGAVVPSPLEPAAINHVMEAMRAVATPRS